jgi:hypothetical protein
MFIAAGTLALPAASHAQSCSGQWSNFANVTGDTGYGAYCTLKLPNGDLIVGGTFFRIASVNANNVARYNAATDTWTPLGTGTNGSVYALALLPDGRIAMGGSFSSAGTATTASNVALYNPTTGTWSALGAGTDNTVKGLAVTTSGDLIVGGSFFNAGGLPSFGLARYTPGTSTWSLISTRPNSNVNAVLALPNGRVAVAGQFGSITVGSAAATFVGFSAIVDPVANTLTGLGIAPNFGVADWTYAIASTATGDLIYSGIFTTTTGGSVPASRIARYTPGAGSGTGGSWSTLGAGLSGITQSLLILPNGDIVAGGAFTSAGGAPANNIARYRPSTNSWSSFGTGITGGSVQSLARLDSGVIIAAGQFRQAGSAFVTGLAKWTPGCSSIADIAGLGGSATCDGQITVDDLIRFLGGFFNRTSVGDVAGLGGSIGPDGQWTADDLIAFLNAFFIGCP